MIPMKTESWTVVIFGKRKQKARLYCGFRIHPCSSYTVYSQYTVVLYVCCFYRSSWWQWSSTITITSWWTSRNCKNNNILLLYKSLFQNWSVRHQNYIKYDQIFNLQVPTMYGCSRNTHTICNFHIVFNKQRSNIKKKFATSAFRSLKIKWSLGSRKK